MPADLLVIGIDAATWSVIDEHIDDLPNFKRLKDEGNAETLTLDQKPWSASCWASMFSGATEEEHGHTDFVEDGEVQTRDDIAVEFVWDRLDEQGYDVKALNVPFVVPPYNHNLSFQPPAHGAPTEPDEMEQEIQQVTEKAMETLGSGDLDLFVTCYVSLDKLQHFHWGEDIVPEHYQKVDAAIGRYMDQADKLIVISDHGFCDKEDADVRTLPDETPKGEIKGEHSRDAILITKNIEQEIETIRDVADVIEQEVAGETFESSVPEAETEEERQEVLERSLDEKIALAEEIVTDALERYDPGKTVIGFTGGKDSTAVAYIVKTVCEKHGLEKPTFMFVDHGQHFDAIEQFVDRIAEDWGFDVITVRNDDLIGKADEPGAHVPVDALNARNQREVDRLSQDYEEVPWLMNTEAGNHLLKTVPMNELLEEHDIAAVINGVRWDEQEARSEEQFFSPRESPGHMRVHPILPFTESDIWTFTWDVIVPGTVDAWDADRAWPHSDQDLPGGVSTEDLPISPKYWEGFRSLGSEVSTEKTSSDPAWHQDLENTVEREGRAQDKEGIMKKLRDLGYM